MEYRPDLEDNKPSRTEGVWHIRPEELQWKLEVGSVFLYSTAQTHTNINIPPSNIPFSTESIHTHTHTHTHSLSLSLSLSLQTNMTSTPPYDRQGSYGIQHNHLRSYEQARLQKLADGNGNDAARVAMRLARLNLQAHAARRIQHDTDVTLVNTPASSVATSVYDSDTEGEESATGRGDRTRSGVAAVAGRPNMTEAGLAERQMAAGKKEKKSGKGKKKSFKETLNKVGLTAFSGSAPKSKAPPFVIYPI
jgi:hypothetical protein